MPALDTNVLVRYVVRDDPRQTREASEFITQFAGRERAIFVPASVILETEWVLRSVYGFGRDAFIRVLVSLLETREIEIGDEDAIEIAMHFYREHRVDFADCMHAAMAHKRRVLPLVTFDRDASELEGAVLL